jgi:hypothetical protein
MDMMVTMIPDGFAWDEAVLERGDPLNRGLISLLVISDLQPILIGTAFIVQAYGAHATAVSAAHCFEEVRKILHPNPSHHSSALPEFLPPPLEIDLKRVKGLYMGDANKIASCDIEIAVWDCKSDYALLKVIAPPDDQSLFNAIFWLDDQIPLVGDEVGMIGFGEMKVTPAVENSNSGIIERRLVLRVGRVESIQPEGDYLLKTPYVQTSAAVFSGMSGGPVARWIGQSTQIQPFGFISHAPDPQPTHDRSLSGQSVAAILKMEKTIIGEKSQKIVIPVNNIGIGRRQP